MRLALITKYRTQLMGVAIIWIMFFHSSIDVKNTNNLIQFIHRIGYGGVDVFMFLSGFGVYFSISKSKRISEFYKKRLLRILPYYYPIMVVFSLIAYFHGAWTINSVIHNFLLTGFWVNIGLARMFDWYIPALLSLYLITPLFFKLFKKNKTLVTIIFIVGFYAFSYTPLGMKWAYLYNFTFRAPIYFFGFWLADFYQNNKEYEINRFVIFMLFLFSLIGLGELYYLYFYTGLFEYYGLYLLPFGIITFPLCLFLGRFFSFFKNYQFPVLTFFGTYTLSLYIFHERILLILMTFNIQYYQYIGAVLAVIFAYIWQNFIDRLLKGKEG